MTITEFLPWILEMAEKSTLPQMSLLVIAALIWNQKIQLPGFIKKSEKEKKQRHMVQFDCAHKAMTNVHTLLKRAVAKSKCSRATLIYYHNGDENLMGVPFTKISCIAEVIDESGTLTASQMIPNCNDWQNLPSMVLSNAIVLSRDNIIYTIDDINKSNNIPTAMKEVLKSHGTHSTILTSIRNMYDMPIGHISFEFTKENSPVSKEVEEYLLSVNHDITVMLNDVTDINEHGKPLYKKIKSISK